MEFTTLILSLAFALLLAIIARLTSSHRGPFAFVLYRLRSAESKYRSVATMLWVVAIGVLGLGVAATLLPARAESLARWSIYFFAFAPSLVVAIAPTLRRNAP